MILVDGNEPVQAVGWSPENLSRAIASFRNLADTVKVLPVSHLETSFGDGGLDGAIFCPLTTELTADNLPEMERSHPLLAIASRCGDTEAIRQQVIGNLHCDAGAGTFWLPIVVTAKGPLYAEAIGSGASNDADGENTADGENKHYQQPFYLSDRQRQAVYRLGHQVLEILEAPPAVYLLRLGLAAEGQEGVKVWFDRVLPFPGEPAIASLGIQTPNLFHCHWRCITHQPIRDITI